ncbi:MAG: thymidine phosphorylase family protein [Acidobacteriota bacterium]|nr:thymidine phosphorylase family protein [Acidobacteriota bacterium]
MPQNATNRLVLKRLGIDTYQEPVVYMRADCHVCRSEGFTAHSRVLITTGSASIIATLNVVRDGLLDEGEAGLSDAAWRLLDAKTGDTATFSHPSPVDSMSALRAKIFGHSFAAHDLDGILADIAAGRYTDIALAAFLTACAAGGMSLDEVVALTRGMVDVGARLSWPRPVIADKHCVGGLPGNRTSPLVVSIVAAAGVWIPKTSSRAITSPSGTADAMETLTNVDLDLDTMRRVVERENGCIAWGRAVRLSPVDDVLIRVERALDIDSDAQLVASVLSKKVAAGSTHVVIDIPVGPTAKVRSINAAERLEHLLERVGRQMGLQLQAVVTDGTQPIGHGMGPALEARDVLAVATGAPGAPVDLRKRTVRLAGELLEMVGACADDEGQATAAAILDDGRAWKKLQAICEAQGGMRTPPVAAHRHEVTAPRAGQVAAIDNRVLARIAKLAGAPASPASGIDLHVRLGALVHAGQPLFTIHGQTPGELAYAREYLLGHPGAVTIGEAP